VNSPNVGEHVRSIHAFGVHRSAGRQRRREGKEIVLVERPNSSNAPTVPRSLPTRVNIPSGRDGVLPLLVSAHQAAALLGIGRTMLYELIKDGTVKPIRIKRAVRFLVRDLEKYVTELSTADVSRSTLGSNRRRSAS
jgi:excisionase family DNA binding protein